MVDTIIVIGASRGLGLGLVHEYLERGWHVLATSRGQAAGLEQAAAAHPGRLTLERLDVTDGDQASALAGRHPRLGAKVLFVVAGQSSHATVPVHAVPREAAAAEFITNAWAPPVAAEALAGLVAPGGTFVFMTSVLGSLAHASGAYELYSASKAALNMLGIGFAKRHGGHPVILMHPGWVRTDMGGSQAPLDVETSAKGMADVIAHTTKPGIHYLDYAGKALPW